MSRNLHCAISPSGPPHLKLIIAPVLDSAPLNQLLATGGLLFFLQSFATLLFGTDFRNIGVRLPVLVELQPVLEIAQELIGRSQACVFGAGQQRFIAQAEQGKERAAMAHPWLAAAVQPLQALHQKLDIADAAARQLDIQS